MQLATVAAAKRVDDCELAPVDDDAATASAATVSPPDAAPVEAQQGWGEAACVFGVLGCTTQVNSGNHWS